MNEPLEPTRVTRVDIENMKHTVKISSVYDTTDGKEFRVMREAQHHQANIDFDEIINKQVLLNHSTEEFKQWLVENKEVISNICYPHNVKFNKLS